MIKYLQYIYWILTYIYFIFVAGLDYDLGVDENSNFAENADYKTDFDDDIFSDTMDYSEDDTVSTVKRHTDKRVSTECVH